MLSYLLANVYFTIIKVKNQQKYSVLLTANDYSIIIKVKNQQKLQYSFTW